MRTLLLIVVMLFNAVIYAEIYYNRGAAYYALGKFVDALPDAKRAADLNPSNKNLYDKISRKLGR